MLKYIYVFILIIFLSWIKWKLQNNNKIKEDFQTAEQIKLADMFSSSGNSFFDKISSLNSNVKYTTESFSMYLSKELKIIYPYDFDYNFDDFVRVKHFSMSFHGFYGTTIPVLKFNGFEFGFINFNSLNSFIDIRNNGRTVIKFNNSSTLTTPINTSMKDLIEWHKLPL